jgi:hypothetical protein
MFAPLPWIIKFMFEIVPHVWTHDLLLYLLTAVFSSQPKKLFLLLVSARRKRKGIVCICLLLQVGYCVSILLE